MEFEKFDRISNEQLQSIADGKVKGYSKNEIDTVRSVLEWRAANSRIRTCGLCGNPLEGDACPVCGSKKSREVQAHAKATGGLRVWMWFVIIVNSIGACVSLYDAFAIHNIYSMLFIAFMVMMILVVFGSIRLLNGYKSGFYIICACIVISACVNIIVFKFSADSFLSFGNLASLVVIRLFARNQWNSFE